MIQTSHPHSSSNLNQYPTLPNIQKPNFSSVPLEIYSIDSYFQDIFHLFPQIIFTSFSEVKPTYSLRILPSLHCIQFQPFLLFQSCKYLLFFQGFVTSQSLLSIYLQVRYSLPLQHNTCHYLKLLPVQRDSSRNTLASQFYECHIYTTIYPSTYLSNKYY